MAEESILTDEFLRQLIDVGEADVLVGVPTYNNAATVGQVVQTIRAGLLNIFPANAPSSSTRTGARAIRRGNWSAGLRSTICSIRLI